MAYKRIGRWQSFEIDISDSTTLSDECDLEGYFDYMLLEVPTVDKSRLTIQPLRVSGGTVRNLSLTIPTTGEEIRVRSASTTGAYMWCVPLHGVRYFKVLAEIVQTADRTFYARGIDQYLTWN